MAESFFEKLKKGMGVEISEKEPEKPEEKIKEKPEKRIKISSPAVKKAPPKKIIVDPQLRTEPKPAEPEMKEVKKPEEKPNQPEITRPSPAWQDLGGQEGKLALDVYQTNTEVVIQSAIAGVKPEELDISIEDDEVLIKGKREQPPETGQKNYSHQECFWGQFSGQVILPEETDSSRAIAEMKEGILTIRIPKVERKKIRKITVKG